MKSIAMVCRATVYEAMALAVFAGIIVLFVHAMLPLVGDIGELEPHAAAVNAMMTAATLDRVRSWFLISAEASRGVPQP